MAQFTRRSFFDAVEALRHACQNEPECGLVWSMLSRLYTVNYGTELFELDTPIDEAIGFTQTGVKLNPTKQRTRAALAYALMLADEIPAARAEADRALALNPESLIFLDAIGYLLTLLGDWQRGPALINKPSAPFLITTSLSTMHYGWTCSGGRILISRYVKFDEIFERLIAGLNRAGVDLDCEDVVK
jgi:tetratricopeptide (TPR) repeat protein